MFGDPLLADGTKVKEMGAPEPRWCEPDAGRSNGDTEKDPARTHEQGSVKRAPMRELRRAYEGMRLLQDVTSVDLT